MLSMQIFFLFCMKIFWVFIFGHFFCPFFETPNTFGLFYSKFYTPRISLSYFLIYIIWHPCIHAVCHPFMSPLHVTPSCHPFIVPFFDTTGVCHSIKYTPIEKAEMSDNPRNEWQNEKWVSHNKKGVLFLFLFFLILMILFIFFPFLFFIFYFLIAF
jgi:hypothetical protein